MLRLGIDFGTYNSSVALYDGNEVIPIKEPVASNYVVPSSIFVESNGKIHIGRQADNRRRRDASRYKNGLKRYLGEKTPLKFGATTLTPVDAIAEIIGKLKRDADNYLMSTGRVGLNDVVITVPASYRGYKIDLMRQATLKAGFANENIEFLKEPVAAGLYYAYKEPSRIQAGEILLVYDLGGGTFDTALLERQGDNFALYKGSELGGLETCGGMDFDHMIYQDLLTHHPEIQQFLDTEQNDQAVSLAQANISEACIELKHQLSVEEESSMSIPMDSAYVPSGLIYHTLTRATFNGMIASTIERTIICCKNMVQQAHLSPEQISRILLVGGSCRIPSIEERLRQEFQCPIEAEDLELVVCKGAALYKDSKPDKEENPQHVPPPPGKKPKPPIKPTIYILHEDPFDLWDS